MNKKHELNTLEADIYQAQLSQQLKGNRAIMRAERLESYRTTVGLLLNDVENLDEEVVNTICEQLRKKIKELDI